MAYAHDGRLLNIKASDFGKYNSTSFATGNNVSPKQFYRIEHAKGSFYLNYATNQGGGFSNTHGPNGHRFTNANDNTYSGTPGVTANNPLPFTFKSTTARPRTNSTGSAPSITIASMPVNTPASTISGRGSTTTNSNLKFSELAGIGSGSIPTDVCDNARGQANSVSTVDVYPPDGPALTNGTFVVSKGSGNNEYSSYYGTTATNIAYTVVHCNIANSWVEVKLNTIAAAGDMVVVYLCTTGGSMYTHSIDPIYLRSPTGASHSGATIATYMAPNKNETGMDTWNAGYYATVGSGGNVGRVGFNPYRSSGTYMPTIAHIFVIKKGFGTIGVPTVANGYTHLKTGSTSYGTPQNNSTYNAYPRMGGAYFGNSHGDSNQAFNITIATSPFTSGGNFGQWSSSNASHSGQGVDWDMAFAGCGSLANKGGVYGFHGVWSVTIDNYTGYYYYTAGKYGTVTYPGSGSSNYTPQPTWGYIDTDYAVHALTIFR